MTTEVRVGFLLVGVICLCFIAAWIAHERHIDKHAERIYHLELLVLRLLPDDPPDEPATDEIPAPADTVPDLKQAAQVAPLAAQPRDWVEDSLAQIRARTAERTARRPVADSGAEAPAMADADGGD